MGPTLPLSWRTCLLHWINCILKRNVHNIKELADWKVFFNLINTLDENKNEPVVCYKTAVYLFFQREYPHFNIKTDLDTLENIDDIVLVTSLLVHYSCMKKKDDAIRVRMCQRLDAADQKAIMLFADNLIKHEHITDVNLINAITASSLETAVSFDDIPSMSMSTPLRIPSNPPISHALSTTSLNSTAGRDELKATPASQRSRRVFRLEAELGAERFDRNFLQEELNRQYKIVNELEKMNKTYVTEIQRLRGDYLLMGNSNGNGDMENCTQCVYKEKLIEERQQSHYLEILQLESNAFAVEDERDILKSKLEEMEKLIIEWQTQAIESENICESQKLELERANVELGNVRTILADTTKCLEEYRQQNNMNISIECDDDTFSLKRVFNTSLNLTPENLGKAVVDIQLKEQINRNCNLMDQIDNLKKEKNAMNEVIKDNTEKLKSFDVLNHSLVQDNNKLNEDIQLLQTQYTNLTENFEERNCTINKLILEKKNFEELCDKSFRENEEIQNKLSHVEEKLKNTQSELEVVIGKNVTLQSLYESKIDELTKCKENCVNQIEEIEKLRQNNIAISLKINLLDKSIAEKEEKINNDNTTIDELLLEKNHIQSLYDASVNKVEEYLKKLNFTNEELINTRNQLDETVEKNVKMHGLYKSTLGDLMRSKEECANKNNEIEDLHRKCIRLDEMQEKNITMTCTIEKLEKSITAKDDQISSITTTMSELLTTKNELQCLYEKSITEIEDNNKKISLMHQDFDNQNEQLNVLTESNHTIQALYASTVESLKKSEENCANKNNDIEELKEKIIRSNAVMKDSDDKIQYFEKLIAEKENNIIYANNEISKLSSEKNNILDLYEKSVIEIESSEKKLTLSAEELKTKNEQFDLLCKEKTEILALYESTSECLKERTDDCVNKDNDIRLIREENIKLLKEFDEINANVEQLEKIITEKEREIIDIQMLYKNSAIEIKKNANEISHLNDELTFKTDQLEIISEKLQISEEDCQNKNNEIDDFHKQIMHLSNTLEETKNTIISKEKYFNELVIEKVHEITSANVKLDDLIMEKNNLQKLYDDCVIEIQEYQNEIDNLRKKNILLESTLEDIKVTMSSKVDYFETLVVEKDHEISNNKNIIEKLSLEKINIHDLYQKCVTEIEEIENKLSFFKEKLKNKENQIEMLQKENCEIQELYKSTSECVKKHEEEHENKNKHVEELLQNNNNLNVKLMEMDAMVKSTIENKDNLMSKRELEITNLNKRYDDIILEKNDIQKAYDNSIIEIKGNQNEISLMKSELKNKTNQLEVIIEELEKSKDECLKKTSEIEDKQQEIVNLSDSLQKVNCEIQELYKSTSECVKKHEEEHENKNKRVEELLQNNNNLNDKLMEMDTMVKSTIEHYDNLMSKSELEITNLNKRYDDVILEKNDIQKSYDNSIIEIKGNQNEISRMNAELKNKTNQLEVIIEKLEKSKVECLKKTSEIEDKQQEIINLSNTLEETKNTMSSKEENFYKLINEKEEEIKNVNIKLDSISLDKINIHQLYENSITKIKEDQDKFSSINDELKIMTDQLQTQEENYNASQSLCATITEKLEKLEEERINKNNEIEDLHAKNILLDSALEEIRTSTTSKVNHYEQQIENNEEIIKSSNKTIEELLAEKISNAELLKKSIIEIEEDKKAISSINEELNNKNKELETMIENNNSIQVLYTIANEKLKKFEEDCANKNGKIEEQFQKNIHLEELNATFISKVDYFEKLIEDKEVVINGLLSDKNNIQVLYDKSIIEIEDIQKKLTNINDELRTKTNQLEIVYGTNEEIKALHDLALDKLKKYEEDCVNNENNIEELRQSIKKLEQMNATLTSESEQLSKSISDKEEHISNSYNTINELLSERDNIRGLYEKSVIQTEENHKKISLIEEELKNKNSLLEEKGENIIEIRSLYESAAEKLLKTEEDCFNKTKEIEELNHTLEENTLMKSTIQDLEKSIEEHIHKNINIDDELKKKDIVFQSKIEEFELLLKTKEEEIKNNNVVMNKLLLDKNNIQDLYDKSVFEIKQYEERLSNADKQFEIISKENITIKSLHEASIVRMEEATKECELKERDNNDLRENNTRLNQLLKESESKNALMESHENTELKLQIDLITNEKSQLAEQVKSLNEKLNDANMRIYKDNVKPLVDYDRMLQDNLKLAEKLKHKDTEIDVLRNATVDYNALKTSYDTLFNEYKKLQNQHLLGTDTNRLITDMRNEYEDKLTRMKQKMKQLYQEQIAVYSEKQKAETAELEALCKKYTEKIKNYEGHVNQLSSELWKVGEKLLMEKNEKDWLKQRLNKERGSQQSLHSISSTISLPQTKVETFNTIKRQTVSRADSKFNISNVKPDAKRHLFKTPDTSKVESGGLHMSDEETELFDNTYLEELKSGVSKHRPVSTIGSNIGLPQNRLSELQWRNSLCLPHLKSSYPAETQFQKFKEEIIKTGTSDDSPTAKSNRPKKEAGQTSYKRPGPPTPSKKGGRVSLQGNELRDPLKEHNDNVSKKTTPSRIKALFKGNTSKSSSRDENTFGTPKSKRLSIFRKPR